MKKPWEGLSGGGWDLRSQQAAPPSMFSAPYPPAAGRTDSRRYTCCALLILSTCPPPPGRNLLRKPQAHKQTTHAIPVMDPSLWLREKHVAYMLSGGREDMWLMTASALT